MSDRNPARFDVMSLCSLVSEDCRPSEVKSREKTEREQSECSFVRRRTRPPYFVGKIYVLSVRTVQNRMQT